MLHRCKSQDLSGLYSAPATVNLWYLLAVEPASERRYKCRILWRTNKARRLGITKYYSLFLFPVSPLKFGGTGRLNLQSWRLSRKMNQACFPPASRLIFCSAHSSNLKLEATCSSETSVDFQRIIWGYIPEDRTLRFNYYFYRCTLRLYMYIPI